AAALIWGCSDKLPRLPDLAALPLDAQEAEGAEEQDDMFMDVGLPTPVLPTVQAPAAAVTSAPVSPAGSQVVSATTFGADDRSTSVPRSDTPLRDMVPALASTSGAGSTTTFFQVSTQAQSVVYVIDRSGSMGNGGRMALARRELLASLDRLPVSARFQIIPY